MYERIKHMLIKEFLQTLRDPKMMGSVFVMPIVQIIMFGYAVTTDVKHIATALYDLDNSVASRELVARFVRSGYFDIVAAVSDDRHARKLLDHGEAQAVLRLNKGFQNDLRAGRTVPLQVIVDGTDSNTARIVLAYSAKIVDRFSQQVLIRRLTHLKGAFQQPGRVELQARAWFNENLASRNFFVPGVIALVVMNITLTLTSMAVVREKEIGTLEQLMVTPISPAEFILGKTVPFALIGMADVLLVMVSGVWWFEVPIRGHLLWLFLATVLFLMTTLGAGLLISTISQTQQQAMMSTFFFFSPVILLSGFIFPIANMPVVVQWLTYLNPLRYYLVIIRSVFLKGVGPNILWPQLLALAVMGFVTLWLASQRVTKTLA